MRATLVTRASLACRCAARSSGARRHAVAAAAPRHEPFLSVRLPASSPHCWASGLSTPAHAARRCAAVARQAEGLPASGAGSESLRATADSDVARLGGAIAAHIRQSGRATIQSISSKAAYQAIKALVTAADYLSQDANSSSSGQLGAEFSERSVRVDDDGGEARRTVMFIEAQLFTPPKPEGAPRELAVGAKTHAGRAAAAIASSLRPHAEAAGAGAIVRAMGAAAVHQAMIATVFAQKYLDNDGRGVKFLAVPGFEDTGSGGKRSKQFVLRIMRVNS